MTERISKMAHPVKVLAARPEFNLHGPHGEKEPPSPLWASKMSSDLYPLYHGMLTF